MDILRLVAGGLTIAVVAGVAIAGLFYAAFAGSMSADVERLIADSRPGGTVVSDAMIAALPETARRYFRYAGIVGKPIPRLVRLTQKGRIRASASDKWMQLEADETYSTTPPALVWRSYFPSKFMPVALGRDEYLGGKGSIVMKMLAAVPLADEHGPELGPAGLMRYLNEAMWFPAAFLGPNVTIGAIDDSSFGLKIVDRGMAAEAVIFVDAEGRITNFRAQRFNTSTHRLETWETPVTGYGTFNGLQLPKAGSAVWKLPTGDLDYIELEITSLQYQD
jgi:hypothetical protein